jgi:uncharacterized protein
MAPRSTDPRVAAVPDAPVESPCIRLCTLDDNDVCLGCFRDIAEICAWGMAAEAQRREIVQAAAARRDAYRRRA